MGGVLIGKVIIEAYWWNHGTVELGLGAVAHAPICPDKREGLARPPPTRDLPAALTPPAHPRRLWRNRHIHPHRVKRHLALHAGSRSIRERQNQAL